MPIVRFAGSVMGAQDPNRKVRAKLLYRLFDAGWDIYNSNGDQTISLDNIQKKIIESDAFVFTPSATLEDFFKAASIFVGFQTNDADLLGKPTVILNSDNSWDVFIDLIGHLNEMGTVHQPYHTFLSIADKPKEVMKILEREYRENSHKASDEPSISEEGLYNHNEVVSGRADKPAYNICVFCSASIKKQKYLDYGYDIGKMLAEQGWGCVSGAGKTGIMGQVVKGSFDAGGWAAGSNVPHIIEMEGLPEGLSEFWPRADIYTRMDVMLEESDGFIIMPGGLGTVQELLALIIMKQQNRDIMRDKEIVIVNVYDEEKQVHFWQSLLDLLHAFDVSYMYDVVETPEQAIELLKNKKR